jgi:UDP-N-acetylmuramyl pentapeptide phosphotransferase/UDP-N-acetylglucosamine-1-phosphate transferase
MRAILIDSGATALAAWALLFALLRSGIGWRIAVDRPNQRSLHSRAVPRVGGLIVMGTALIAMSIVAPSLQVITVGAVGLTLLSAIDDRRGLNVTTRLFVQLLAAAITSYALMPAAPWWLILSIVVIIMWSMNLYNFMDGADGLAGGMAVFGFAAFAFVAANNGADQIALACACIAGAAAGFLFHNFPPARVFLGDAGSSPLGFLAATVGIAGWKQGIWPAWFPILVFSPFIVDATSTLVQRAIRRQRIWQAHREHLYQRMVTEGFGHIRTVTAWYALMALVAVSAVTAVSWPIRWQIGLLFAWLGLYSALYVLISRLIRRPANET